MADHDALLDVAMIADVAAPPDGDARQDVGERPDPGALADLVRLHQRGRVDENAVLTPVTACHEGPRYLLGAIVIGGLVDLIPGQRTRERSSDAPE